MFVRKKRIQMIPSAMAHAVENSGEKREKQSIRGITSITHSCEAMSSCADLQ